MTMEAEVSMSKLERGVGGGGPSFRVLGVRVDAVQIADVVRRMEDWIAQRGSCQYIAVTGMHGATEAQHDAQFKAVLNSAGVVGGEGLPLAAVRRWVGVDERTRVCGRGVT